MERSLSVKMWENMIAEYPKLGNFKEVLDVCFGYLAPFIHSEDRDV